ncbi:MAG: enhanced intracellular survival protein Eis [Myxococcota bacterium]
MLRPYTPEDAPGLARQMSLAFGGSTDVALGWFEASGADNLRVWDDGGLVGGLVDIPMGQFFGGRAVRMHGVAGVVMDPAARGRGAGRAMMQAYLRELADKGVALSCLYASTRSLYRSVGYGVAGTIFDASLPTDKLRGQGVVSPHWQAIEPDDRPEIEAAYRAWSAPRSGRPVRERYLWDRIWARRETQTYAFAHRGPEGLDGWVVVRLHSTDGSFLMLQVVDYEARSASALRAVIGFIGGFSTMARTVELKCGPSDPILDFLPEFSASLTLYEPWMLRIIDVEAAMQERGWPSGVQAALDLDIVDPTLPSAAGRWRVQIDDGAGTATRGGNGTIGITITGLAALYSGYASPWELRLTGDVQGPAESMSVLAAAFSGPAPCMSDKF